MNDDNMSEDHIEDSTAKMTNKVVEIANRARTLDPMSEGALPQYIADTLNLAIMTDLVDKYMANIRSTSQVAFKLMALKAQINMTTMTMNFSVMPHLEVSPLSVTSPYSVRTAAE